MPVQGSVALRKVYPPMRRQSRGFMPARNHAIADQMMVRCTCSSCLNGVDVGENMLAPLLLVLGRAVTFSAWGLPINPTGAWFRWKIGMKPRFGSWIVQGAISVDYHSDRHTEVFGCFYHMAPSLKAVGSLQ